MVRHTFHFLRASGIATRLIQYRGLTFSDQHMDTIDISPTQVHTKVIRRDTRDDTGSWVTADSSIVPRPCANHWTDQHQVTPFTHITGDGVNIALYINQENIKVDDVRLLCFRDQYTSHTLQVMGPLHQPREYQSE